MWCTVKQVNFVGNLILQVLLKIQICEIKLLQNLCYIDSKGIGFQFSWKQVATKLAMISNSQKENLPRN